MSKDNSQTQDPELQEQDFEPVDLDQVIADELETDQADGLGDMDLPEWAETKLVVIDGQEFEIAEPDLKIIIAIINSLSRIGLRGERIATQNLANLLRDESGALLRGDKGRITPAMRAVFLGALASVQVGDLYRLGAAVLQFEDERAGRKWLEKHNAGLSPIVRALFLNLMQSQDLRDSLVDFFAGLGAVGVTLENLNLL